MLINPGPLAELEETLLKHFRSLNGKKGEKIQPIRKLAQLLNTPSGKMQRALKSLSKKGYLEQRRGDGTYIKDKLFKNTKAEWGVSPNHDSVMRKVSQERSDEDYFESHNLLMPSILLGVTTLKVLITLDEREVDQVAAWRQVIALYRKLHPYIDLVVHFKPLRDPDNLSYPEKEFEGYDIVFLAYFHFGCWRRRFQTLAAEDKVIEFIDPRNFTYDLIESCVCEGGLKAVPLLQTQAIVSVNQAIVEKYGIDPASLKSQRDLFRAGYEIEQKSNGGQAGFHYRGFQLSATREGIFFRQERHRVKFDHGKLAEFLAGIKPFFTHRQCQNFGFNYKAMLDGSWGIYLHFSFQFTPEVRKVLNPLPSSIGKDGAPGGSFWTASITENSKLYDECKDFATFLTSYEAQRILAGMLPNWQSIRKDIIDEQRETGYFPPNTIAYDAPNQHKYYESQKMVSDNLNYGPKQNTETIKFFLNKQSIEETVDKLSYL